MTWTVGRRITLGFSIILGLAIIPAVIGAIALQRTVAAHEAALTHQHSVVEAALRADANTGRANLAYLRYLMSGDATFATSFESEVAASRRLYEQVDEAASTPETRAAFGEALRLVDAWHEGARASIAAMSAGRTDEARRIWDERALAARLRLGETIEAGVAAARVQGDEATEHAAAAARNMGLVLLITALLALLIGVLAAWRLNYAVTAPLRESTGVLASSAAEILAATSQQAASAAETSAAVAQTSSTVNEVAQTSEHAADRARVVADLAKRAAEIGKAGRVAVDDSIGAMNEVKSQVENIATSILALAEQAQAIGEIITTVNDVADQTNLLALNAAVEAARSGEHGRGFAVVAAEIRTLAEEAKASTVQVRQILGEIQRATNAAVLTTERGSQHVVAGARQVTEAGETIRSLAEAVAEAAQAAVQIVASAGEQSVGMSQVRQAISNIEEATQQTVASSRQAEQAAHDLNRLGRRLLDLVGRDGFDSSPSSVRA